MADGWRVIAQRQTSDLTADGRFQDVVEVTFELDGGTTGTVRVPLQQFAPEVVRERIEEYAQRLRAVENL